jgi:anti-sigma factor RsiW
MSGTHPSDEVLQQFVLDPTVCAAGEIDHIGSCPECQEAAAAYRMLADALQEQLAPTFDFDLAAAVIGRLEPLRRMETPKVRKRQEGSVLTAILIATAVVIPAWLFRRSAYFVFTDMSAAFYWVLLAAAGIVVGIFLLRLYKRYQNVINLINK